VELCARCVKPVGNPQFCWRCESELCLDCCEELGVCLTFECVRNQNDLMRATTHAERAAIMARPGPNGGDEDAAAGPLA
jgi:hypothetical protein